MFNFLIFTIVMWLNVSYVLKPRDFCRNNEGTIIQYYGICGIESFKLIGRIFSVMSCRHITIENEQLYLRNINVYIFSSNIPTLRTNN